VYRECWLLIALVQSYVRSVNLYSLKAEPEFVLLPLRASPLRAQIHSGPSFQYKGRPRIETGAQATIKTFPKFSIDASLDENLVVGLPLKVFKGQGWNSSRKSMIIRKRLVHLEACCHWDIPNDFRITVSIRLGPVEMNDVDMRYVDDE
jgi:hypothetical protein